METIPVTRSSMPDYDEYCREIKKLWDSRWLTNMGEEHAALQAALERYLGCPHVVLHANGHLALENTLAAMGLPRGGEVITTPFTFASTTHAIARGGLTPVFCDVESDTYTMDAGKIEALITDKTVAILPVHVYGHLCDVEAIDHVAKRYGLPVIYDAAHAFAVRYKGVSAVCFGDAAILSFHATKVFHTIEGGAVCLSRDDLVAPLNDLRDFGIRGPEECVTPGGNAKMNEFQAAMGLCNLRRVDGEIARRKRLAERYCRKLGGVPGVRLCPPQEGVTPNYAYFPVVFDDGFGASRDAVYDALAARRVMARKYFYPLTSRFPCYAHLPTAGEAKTPVAAWAARRVLALPLYADLAPEDADRVCETILACGKA